MELPPERNEFVFSFFVEHMTWGFLSYGPNRAGPVEKQINFLIRLLIMVMIYIIQKIDSCLKFGAFLILIKSVDKIVVTK